MCTLLHRAAPDRYHICRRAWHSALAGGALTQRTYAQALCLFEQGIGAAQRQQKQKFLGHI